MFIKKLFLLEENYFYYAKLLVGLSSGGTRHSGREKRPTVKKKDMPN
jgi:hypothetical protein